MVSKYMLDSSGLQSDPIVVDDVRFPDEAGYLRQTCGFTIVKLDVSEDVCLERLKEKYGDADLATFTDPTETEIDRVVADHVLENETLPEFERNKDFITNLMKDVRAA